MKLVFFLIAILTSGRFVQSQGIEISAIHSDVFVGLSNDLRVHTRLKHDSIAFHSSNGKIVRDDIGGVIYIPATVGKGSIYARVFRKGKVIAIDTSNFSITKADIFCRIGSRRNGRTSLNYIKEQGGLVFYVQVNSRHWEPYKIESYRFTIIRAGGIVGSLVEQNKWYSESMRSLLEELKTGDVILISDIAIAKKDLEIFLPVTSSFEIE